MVGNSILYKAFLALMVRNSIYKASITLCGHTMGGIRIYFSSKSVTLTMLASHVRATTMVSGYAGRSIGHAHMFSAHD